MLVLQDLYSKKDCIVDDDINKDELDYFNLLYNFRFHVIFNNRGYSDTLRDTSFGYRDDKMNITLVKNKFYCISIEFKDYRYFDIYKETESLNEINTLLNKHLKIAARKSKLKLIL